MKFNKQEENKFKLLSQTLFFTLYKLLKISLPDQNRQHNAKVSTCAYDLQYLLIQDGTSKAAPNPVHLQTGIKNIPGKELHFRSEKSTSCLELSKEFLTILK